MITKNQIRLITSLHQKKFRKEEGLFVAEGEKVVKELLKSELDVVSVYATDIFFQNLRNDVRIAKNTEVELIEESELKKISALTTPQKVVAVARIPEESPVDFDNGLKLVLDDISDPGNMGTIIRIADWFGIKDILCSNGTVDCFNPKVVQGSMGSLFKLNIVYEDLEEVFENNKTLANLPVYGMMLDGNNIYNAPLRDDAFILLGSESAGIHMELEKFITDKITIPGFESKADSLNVAVATGIVCYEFQRRNGIKK